MNSERASRWIELVIAIGSSVATSAIVVSWTISSSLARVEANEIADHARILTLEANALSSTTIDATQSERIARNEERFDMIKAQLIELNDKIDEMLGGKPRPHK
jgi:flagellar basal body-associated protein FliL